jgi:hypothetical protein
MKEEDRDWIIYHLAIRTAHSRFGDLVRESGFSEDLVRDSVSRLEKNFLVEVAGDKIRGLSVGESLVRCQCRYMEDSPVSFEDGIIRARRKGEEGE